MAGLIDPGCKDFHNPVRDTLQFPFDFYLLQLSSLPYVNDIANIRIAGMNFAAFMVW